MTNEEILEAEKLIADMRNVLTALAGTTDREKIIALLNEKVSRIAGRLYLVLSGPDRDQFLEPLSRILMSTMMPDQEGLLNAVATNVPLIDSALDKIAQALRDKRQ